MKKIISIRSLTERIMVYFSFLIGVILALFGIIKIDEKKFLSIILFIFLLAFTIYIIIEFSTLGIYLDTNKLLIKFMFSLNKKEYKLRGIEYIEKVDVEFDGEYKLSFVFKIYYKNNSIEKLEYDIHREFFQNLKLKRLKKELNKLNKQLQLINNY